MPMTLGKSRSSSSLAISKSSPHLSKRVVAQRQSGSCFDCTITKSFDRPGMHVLAHPLSIDDSAFSLRKKVPMSPIKFTAMSPKGVGENFGFSEEWNEVPLGIKKLAKSGRMRQEWKQSLSPSNCRGSPVADDFARPSSSHRFETLPSQVSGSGASVSRYPERQLSTAPSTSQFLKSGAFSRRANPPNTELRRHYDDSHLPLQLWHGGVQNQLRWTTPPAQCNLKRLLPVFIGGLRELEEPYKFVALQGSLDMINGGQSNRVLIILDFIIPRMQSCLNTRIVPVISRVLLVLRTLLKSHPSAGPFLVPHYKKLFPIMSSFLRNPSHNVGTEVLETLELMEKWGGTKAFREIKDYIPTYQSVSN